MMYSEKFVAVVKCGGKILREHDDIVYIPFDSEYSIYLNSMSNRKALVKIWIDGKEVTANGLILNPNKPVELERFIGDDMDKGYKFKFIQKTKKIQDHRGDKAEDGIIRIEWWLEKEVPVAWISSSYHSNNYRLGSSAGGSSMYSNSFSKSIGDVESRSIGDVFACSTGPNSLTFEDSPKADEGITVEGSDSKQGFVYGHIGVLEPTSSVIVLKLMGTNKNQEEIKRPITVHTKVRCKTCGTICRSNQNFCEECGTRIIVR